MKLPFHIDLSHISEKRFGPEPERDWLILLTLALILLAASALGNAFLYKSAVRGAPLGTAQASAVALPSAALEQVESTFTARAAQQMSYESGAASFVDPAK